MFIRNFSTRINFIANFFRFSLVCDFSDIFMSLLTVLFMWSLVTVSGALLMIAELIVQYCFNWFAFVVQSALYIQFNSLWNLVEPNGQFGDIAGTHDSDCLRIWYFICRMWTGPTNYSCTERMQWCDQPVRLVSAIIWYSAASANHHKLRTTIRWHQVLWQCDMQSRNIQICP